MDLLSLIRRLALREQVSIREITRTHAARAAVYESGGQRFESFRARHLTD